MPKIYRIFKKLYLYYIYNRAYGQIQFKDYLSYEGIHLTLPITQHIMEQLEPWQIQNLFNRHMALLEDKDIKICWTSYPEIISNEVALPVMTVGRLQFLLINHVLDEIIQYIPVDEKDMKFAIICDENELGKYMIGAVYDRINYLSLICKDPSYYTNLINQLYDDCGLMVLAQSFDDAAIIDADLIINVSSTDLKLHHQLNKKVVFIDLVGNDYINKVIHNKRKDIIWIDDFTIKVNNQCIRKEIFEMILYIEKPEVFRNIIHGNFKSIQYKEIKKIINTYDINIYRFNDGTRIIKRQIIAKKR